MASLIGGFNFVSQISILPSRFVPDFQNLIQSNPSSSNLIWSILLSFVLYFFPSYLSVCPSGEDVKNVPSKKMLDLDKIETNLFRIKKWLSLQVKEQGGKEGRREGGKDGRKEGSVHKLQSPEQFWKTLNQSSLQKFKANLEPTLTKSEANLK